MNTPKTIMTFNPVKPVKPSKTLKLTLILGAIAVLAGCSNNKPPACADIQTLDRIKSTLTSGFSEVATREIDKLAPEQKDRIGKLTQQFLSDTKIDLNNVVTNGYEEGAKRYVCAAKLTIKMPVENESPYVAALTYVTQRTEESTSSFLLAMNDVPATQMVMFSFLRVYLANKQPAAMSTAPETKTADAASQVSAAGGAPMASAPGNGLWVYNKRDGVAEIHVSGNELKFKLNSSVSDHVCNFEGTAPLANGAATYRSADKSDQCVASFKLNDRQLSVKTEECQAYCGMQAGGSMDGTYTR